MKTKQEAIQEQIDEIMDTFDFDKVHAWMKHDNWEWHNEGVPDVTALRLHARERLKSAAANEGISSTGGFMAEYEHGTDGAGGPFIRLTLSFGYSTYNDGTSYKA